MLIYKYKCVKMLRLVKHEWRGHSHLLLWIGLKIHKNNLKGKINEDYCRIR